MVKHTKNFNSDLRNFRESDINILDDNNLVFFGLSFADSLSYQDMLDVTTFHKSLKKSEYVKRVFSIVNDRQIINTGLFPISKKVLNLSNKESYIKSIKKIEVNGNNFVSSDGKKLLFLVENVSGLSKGDSRIFINSLYETDLSDNMTDMFISGRSPSELYFEKKVIQEIRKFAGKVWVSRICRKISKFL